MRNEFHKCQDDKINVDDKRFGSTMSRALGMYGDGH